MSLPLLLIVDDERTTREGLNAALEDHFDIYLAQDLKSAIRLVEEENFDVILTDLRMSGKEDGFDLIRRAKSRPHPPVCILMTAYGSEDIAVEAMKQGADDYISKGRMQIDELEMRIARALKHRKLEEENSTLHRQLSNRFGLENDERRPVLQRRQDRLCRQAELQQRLLQRPERGRRPVRRARCRPSPPVGALVRVLQGPRRPGGRGQARRRR